MVKTAEQKVRDRYRADLENGKTPRALTDANRAVLEEVRAEVAAGCRAVQAAAFSGRKRIREAGDEEVRRVERAGQRVLQQIGDAQAAAASSAPSAPVAEKREAAAEPEEEGEVAVVLLPVQAYAAPAEAEAEASIPRVQAQAAPAPSDAEAEAEATEPRPPVQAFASIASLQKLATEVRCERQEAQWEGEGLAFHDGFQQAKKAFAAGFHRAALQPLVSNSWLRECAEQAGLGNDYRELLARRESHASLGNLSWA